MSRLDGYSLRLASPPHHPTIGIAYSTRSLSRTSSSSSLKPASLKRKRSEQSMSVTITVAQTPTVSAPDAPLILPIIFPSVKRNNTTNSDNAYVSPASPAPTELLDDVDEPSDVCMERAKAAGVKVRDFAYEPLPKGPDPRAPELWTTPLEALITHDQYVRVAPRRADNYRLSGRDLHRLLSLGWVTYEEARYNWRIEDWDAMHAYRERPLGAYPFCIPKGVKKPTAAYRAALRADKHVPMSDDIPEEKIFVPEDEPGMDDGPTRVDDAFLRKAVAALRGATADVAATNAAALAAHARATEGAEDCPHADKKRRISDPTPTTSGVATPPGTPSASAATATARTPSCDKGSATPSASRPSSPPARAPQRLTRRRAGLARTETFGMIA